MFAERVAPLLDDLDRILAMNISDVSVADRARVGSAKITAGRNAAAIRAMLAPGDDDG